jgi:bifunctional non-homologous end joining protein LigD
MPVELKPQLASVAAAAPAGPDWVHEIKYDGYRLFARIEHGKVRLITRNGLDWTTKFPELARTLGQLPLDTALVDGELVCLAADGTTSFSDLQDAISSGKTGALNFFAFDLVYRDGWDLTGASLEDRKSALSEITPPDAHGMLRYSDHQAGQGPAFLRQACDFALEGIVSKRRDAPYRPGRGTTWLKVKCRNREEFVVIAFTDPEGRRDGFGALLVGYYDSSGTLRYAGRVGTGFSAARLADLRRRFDALVIKDPPVVLPKDAPRKGVHWVRPAFVAEVEFAGWTADSILRHASFQGLREDKDPREVVYDPSPGTAAPTMTPATKRTRSASPAPAISEPARDGSIVFEGVRLTHPDRVLYPEDGFSKLDLAHYYAAVRDWALPQLAHRPLTLVRCPGGQGKPSFYQKHLGKGAPDAIGHVDIADDGKTEAYPVVEDLPGLIGLVQMDVLEIHPWGSTVDKLDTPDRITFDLDPDEGLPWERVTEAALVIRDALVAIGLESFAKTTGGKGLHVVVPLQPKLGWDEVKSFTKWVADQLVAHSPEGFTANQSKRARQGRIYIDYLRNARGATAIGAYSLRARPGAPVSTPLFWEEVEKGVRPEGFTIATVPQRLAGLDADPWAEIGKLRQSINAAVRRRMAG